MFLKEVLIKNFRSLKDVRIYFDETTVLIGENNAGKSTILDAIRLALNRVSGRTIFEEFDFYMDEQINSPKESEGIIFILKFEERVIEEWDGYITDMFIDAIQYPDGDKAAIYLKVSALYNELTSEIEAKTEFLDNNLEPIIGRIQSQVRKFLNLTPIFYLQALREINDVFGARSPLWGKFVKKVDVPQNKIKDIQNQIEKINKDIILNDENLADLVNELQRVQKVINFQGDNLVSINAVPLKSWDLLSKAQVVLNNVACNTEFPLEKHGQGTQSVSAILLFKAYISILLTEPNSDSAEAILTLEEPEAHLHPQAIRALQKIINEIDCQKIITTHSPYFIQNYDIRNIRFISKSKGSTKIKQIKNELNYKVKNVNDNLKTISTKFNNILEVDENNNIITIKEPLDHKIANTIKGCCHPTDILMDDLVEETQNIFSDEEIHNINMCIQKTRGDILFARRWFLYEGQTEEVILPYFATLLGKDFDEHGISGIMYRNNGSAKTFVKLAKILDIPWIVFGDNDTQGEKTKKEVKSCGYDDTTVDRRVILTDHKDIEHELISVQEIMTDYEIFISSKLSKEERQLKTDGKMEEYKMALINKIQLGKLESAFKLREQWEKRNFSQDDIPIFFKKLIEKV